MRSWSLALALLCLVPSCTGVDVGNPVDVAFTIHDAPTGVTIDEAWLGVERLRLRREGECQPDTIDGQEVPGPFVLDLEAVGPDPGLTGVRVSAGVYCRIDVEWSQVEQAGTAPPELVGHSVLLTGTRADGTPFVIRSLRADFMQLVMAEGLIELDAQHGLFIAFDGLALLTNVALDQATVGGDGVIRIEQGSNDPLLADFEAGMHFAASLFADLDNNGRLDPTERDPANALARGM
jgi:hypothetical protein